MRKINHGNKDDIDMITPDKSIKTTQQRSSSNRVSSPSAILHAFWRKKKDKTSTNEKWKGRVKSQSTVESNYNYCSTTTTLRQDVKVVS